MPDVVLHEFPDRSACCQQLALDLAAVLRAALQQRERASLLLPGGSSPQALLPLLAAERLDWARVDLSPTDERWVPAAAAQSNYRLLGEGLPLARVLDPRQGAATLEQAAQRWQACLQHLQPFAAVLLGMGEDGHFASLFPDMPGLSAALDPQAAPAVLAALAPSEPRQRLSPNLAMLCHSRWLGLLAFGAAKRQLLEAPADLPLQALLGNGRQTVQVYWAP
ncbi:hypothetical protein A9179_07270 [Pseudomonas alcaligenes]|uniref:Glucosamine/galactosamine-6-phosphate isomerase domain-containing protein n=1 Tax=Aquipseudomonas alcaligenes TaxID=43263 RepID=A0ABR7RXK9_AQUAC|nr:6-phosphogluconolactonase [Pseudomonas alcaligenes]MBC9250071.1 hypothetical protein [Pseudomonas alcaligenes]